MVDKSDPLLGLGGSACLQQIHGLKTGAPPRCDLEKERELHNTLRGFIFSGLVKSAHDCSEGGLAVALAECCISRQIARDTPRLIGAQIDLSAFADLRLDALLFGETQGRVVISVAPGDAVKVLERARIMEVERRQTRRRRRRGSVHQNQRRRIQVAGGRTALPVVERDCECDAVSDSAAKKPPALDSVSSYSASATESLTMPAPTWK